LDIDLKDEDNDPDEPKIKEEMKEE